MGDSQTIASTASVTLDLPPSAVQFCNKHPEYFVVGTYYLEKTEPAESTSNEDGEEVAEPSKKPQSRNGSLLVFKVHGDKLDLIQTFPQPAALLDIRFSTIPGEEDILAAVSSTGTLAVFRLDPASDATSPLSHLATSRCDDLEEDVLFLQCNWHPSISRILAVTTSTGVARLLHLSQGWQIEDWQDLELQNSLEAWCIALSPAIDDSDNQQTLATIYSGGDDSILRYTTCAWEKQAAAKQSQAPYGSHVVKGRHDAGVTAILPLSIFGKDGGRVVVTGSYDDHLRVFLVHDLNVSHGLRRVELVIDEDLGGGVWRLDLIDVQSSEGSTRIRILASCMHAGARIVELTSERDQDWTCHILARFEEHQSMNYGSHFMPGQKGGQLRCVSVSFYDKLLCLWNYQLESN